MRFPELFPTPRVHPGDRCRAAERKAAREASLPAAGDDWLSDGGRSPHKLFPFGKTNSPRHQGAPFLIEPRHLVAIFQRCRIGLFECHVPRFLEGAVIASIARRYEDIVVLGLCVVAANFPRIDH